QTCGGLEAREMREQVLDTRESERERGITIKAQTVRLDYRAQDGEQYVLNLMDTPGHVDFAYEVSRSLAACEGSLLVVDASQGVEAQTLANVYQAVGAGHEIVPVLNKIDLPAAEPDRVKEQVEDVIGLDASDAILISAKTGLNIDQLVAAVVSRLPPTSRPSPIAGWAIRSPRTADLRPRHCPASNRCSRSFSAASSRRMRPITSDCATASRSSGSTMRVSNTSPRLRSPSASASVAA